MDARNKCGHDEECLVNGSNMRRKLGLGAEYMAPPLFDPAVERIGHIDVDDLPLLPDLTRDIEEWDSVYQATFKEEHPPESGFETEAEIEPHNETGADLAERI